MFKQTLTVNNFHNFVKYIIYTLFKIALNLKRFLRPYKLNHLKSFSITLKKLYQQRLNDLHIRIVNVFE